MKKNSIYMLIGAVVIIGIIVMTKQNNTSKISTYEVTQNNNVSTQGDKQIIEINAKGGYSPSATTAKSGVPTILRIKTNGTYDCSAALRIPDLSYSKNLPATGTTDIEVPAQQSGSTLSALCSMGMYNFTISFSS